MKYILYFNYIEKLENNLLIIGWEKLINKWKMYIFIYMRF